MSDQSQPATGASSKAEAVAEEVKAVVEMPIADPKAEIVPIDMAEPEQKAEIEQRMAELDLSSTQSIIKFGSGAQERLTQISDEMLEGVKNKDAGPAGDALKSMVVTIRGFDMDELDPNRKQSWWDRLLGRTKPVAEFIASYEARSTTSPTSCSPTRRFCSRT